MEGRLILSGGGTAAEELPLFALLVQWIGGGGRLLYLPMAMPAEGGRHEKCQRWICETLGPLGLESITMWRDFSGKTETELFDFDAVFLGGGCTYLLLQHLRSSGFDRVLKEYFRRGGVIFGGSAGAIVLGKDIATCAHIDRNSCNLTDLRGIDLLHGIAVTCHYRGEHDNVLKACAAHIDAPVIALPEGSGLIMESGRFRIDGHQPATYISSQFRRKLQVGIHHDASDIHPEN